MKTRALILTVLLLMLVCISDSFAALAHPNQESTVTLYSINKYRGDYQRSCLNFQTGPPVYRTAPCDLRYGALYAGDDLDWFESSTAQGNRSVIKDLGEQEWTSRFEVPLVQPFPKLKPGEPRQITVDTSGADGRDGADAASSLKTDGAERSSSRTLPPFGSESGRGEFGTPPLSTPPGPPARPKRDGKPRIDPIFVKAVAGHMYIIHVVDDSRDFYALFRVESIERGDRCTLSWKLIPAPVAE